MTREITPEDRLFLSINRCPTHGYYMVSIDDAAGGTRITPSKCCGRWDELRKWPLDERMISDIEAEIARWAVNAAARARKP